MLIGELYYTSDKCLNEILAWLYQKGVLIKYLIIDDQFSWNIKSGPEILTVSPFKAASLIKEKQADIIVLPTDYDIDQTMSLRLRFERLGVDKEKFSFVPIDLYYGSEPPEKNLITLDNLNYAQHLEFHLTHRCNFNCGGCNHFVPLIPNDEEIDFDCMVNDWKVLKKKIYHISDISILGGEPLLCSRLVDYCRILRDLWPHSNMAIYTNGSLIKKVPPEDLAEISRLDIMLRISAYTPVADIYQDIIEYCNSKNIKCCYEIKDGMYPPLHSSKEKKFFSKNTEMCKWLTVENGRLYPCPMITYIKHFNSYFNESYPEESGLNLYDDNLTLKDINKYCSSIHSLCDYCNEYPERGRNSEWLTNEQVMYGNKKDAKKKYWVNDIKED